MPYNTRRKSLSLPSLGIHVPVTQAARAAAAAAAAASRISENCHNDTVVSPASHQSKKLKRSHGGESRRPSSLTFSVPPRLDFDQTPYEHTPPPSPDATAQPIEMDDVEDIPKMKRIDLEGINDAIVEGVIVQLQATANRPHLVKELATVLSQQLTVVQHSANPCAIISSRLSTYLKRSCWSALAPCPLAKELETVHPRRTYFYLTTSPHQPLPDTALAQLSQRTVISPSLSSSASRSDDDEDAHHRRELSPSPEVDLSSPDFDDADDDIAMPSTPVGSLPTNFHVPRSHRSASPPLEKDEREFTQTADGLQKRKLGGDLMGASGTEQAINADDSPRDDSMFDENKSLAVSTISSMNFTTSPAIRPALFSNMKRDTEADSWLKLGKLLEWDHGAEDIELEELDCLLDAC